MIKAKYEDIVKLILDYSKETQFNIESIILTVNEEKSGDEDEFIAFKEYNWKLCNVTPFLSSYGEWTVLCIIKSEMSENDIHEHIISTLESREDIINNYKLNC